MQNEVMEQKEKKPLSKKGKLLRILAIVLAALLLLGGGGYAAWHIHKTSQTEQPSEEEAPKFRGFPADVHTKVLLENVYFEENRVYYKIVNNTTDVDLCRDSRTPYLLSIYKEKDGEWEVVYPNSDNVYKENGTTTWNAATPEVAAQRSIIRVFSFPEELCLEPGHYRLVLHGYLLVSKVDPRKAAGARLDATFDIPAAD